MALVCKLGMVMQPVEDLDAAVRFYTDALGLELKFRDGDRFCALACGQTTIGLAAGAEAITATTAVSYQVEDVVAVVSVLREAGASVLREPERGPHEVRAVLEDPAGHAFVVYARL